ncbi:MAG: NUDIX hydrolase [Patescibacteria group bacterium]
MADSFFKDTKEAPYHLSVGAVLYDDKKQVACHYFKDPVAFGKNDHDYPLDNFYILMRETVEKKESLEHAVLRGIQEEFGATGEIQKFIGTLVTKFSRKDAWIEKTTVYFLIKLKNFDISERALDDDEKVSIIQWQPIDFLILKMQEQQTRYERTDLDESEILKRAEKYLQ